MTFYYSTTTSVPTYTTKLTNSLLNAMFCGEVDSQVSAYPPYNIVSTGDGKFTVDIAVAGIKRDNIVVDLHIDNLKGSSERAWILSVEHKVLLSDIDDAEDVEYLHRGIASRAFSRHFRLPQHSNITECTYKDGLLTIQIEVEVPEDEKPKRIPIEIK